MPTAIITGATGYIGSNLANHLANNGWTLYLIARSTSQLTLLEQHPQIAEIYRGDGQTPSLSRFLSKVRPDVVFHLAGASTERGQRIDIGKAIASNISFGAHLLESMVENQIFRLITTETYWQHFDDQNYSPVDFYAATKQAFRDLLKYYFVSTRLAVVNLTLFDIYGPRDPRSKFFHDLRTARTTGVRPSFSPGNQLLDLTYIEDVVDAYKVAGGLLIQSSGEYWKDYNVSSGNRLTLRQIVSKYLHITGSNITVNWGEMDYRPRQIMRPWSKYPCLPGWSPKVTLDVGIRKMEGLIQ
jgi:nucleoside-diphosphate-sugar epimerase